MHIYVILGVKFSCNFHWKCFTVTQILGGFDSVATALIIVPKTGIEPEIL